MKGTKLFTDFFNSEKSSGLVLIACTIFSLLLANSNFGTNYLELFQAQFAKHSMSEINRLWYFNTIWSRHSNGD